MTTLEWALKYLEQGFHPIPLVSRKKTPLVQWKQYQENAPSAEQLEKWFIKGDSNIGLVLGRGIFALDLDGEGAEDLLKDKGIEIPQFAPRSKTAQGFHILMEGEGIKDRVCFLGKAGEKPQIDVRGVGYIVAEPSIHPSGHPYKWLIPPTQDGIPKAPDDLLKLLRDTGESIIIKRDPNWVAESLKGTAEGNRDALCAKLAGYLIPRNSISIAREILYAFGQKCTPPMGKTEIDKTVDSIGRAEVFSANKKNGTQIVHATQININQEEQPQKAQPATYASWEKLGITLNGNGAPVCNLDNALKVLENKLNGLIWFDEFHNKYFTDFDFETLNRNNRREWSDIDDLLLTNYFQRNLGISKMSDEIVKKAVITHARKHTRNEPMDWIETLSWDGVDRCEMFFHDAFGAEDKHYTRSASLNFWIGMLSRIYQPGGQLDNMVVLEGSQGIGKTTALREIGGSWYSEIKESVTEKDFFMGLQGKLLIEIAELDSFSRAEVTRIKQVITCTVDRFRAPYASTAQDHPRRSIFVGTTNEDDYLKDRTGGRRFWPIACTKISLDNIRRNREQLFAEAAAKFKDGVTWWEMPQECSEREQEARRQADSWEDTINYFLIGKDETTVNEIIKDCLDIKISAGDRGTQMRIGKILHILKFERVVAWRDGRACRTWVRSK